MSKQNWIEIYKFHVFYVTFVAIKLSSLFQYFSSYNTSCSYENNFWVFEFLHSQDETLSKMCEISIDGSLIFWNNNETAINIETTIVFNTTDLSF